MQIDDVVRRTAYHVTSERGTPPTIAALAASCDITTADVRESLRRLAAARFVVVQPVSGELLMVPPFSAVPTAFLVRTPRYTAYANCAWDALGVSMTLGAPIDVQTSCGCCGESMPLAVSHRRSPTGPGVVHFAVPARRWWDDITFT